MYWSVKKKPQVFSDNALTWFAAALALCVAILLDQRGLPQKWHAAIVWTVGTFGSLVIMFRRRWYLWGFWALLLAFFILHLVLMWTLFSKVLANLLVLGMLYVIPLALIESVVLMILLSQAHVSGRKHSAPGQR